MCQELAADHFLIGVGEPGKLRDGFWQCLDHAPSIAFAMVSSSISKWIAGAGVMLLAAVAADTLVPVAFQVRLGLHWLIEHFLAYFAVALLLCLAWPRPIIVAAALMGVAAALEALQGLTADRIPDLPTAFCGAAGVLAGALLASLVTEAWHKR